MEKTAPLEPWKTVRVFHFPKDPMKINSYSEMRPNSGGRSVPLGTTLHGGQRAGGMADASRLFSLAFVKEESS